MKKEIKKLEGGGNVNYDYTGILKVYPPNKTRKIKVKYAKSKKEIKIRSG